jgi:hypothetical protein
MTPSKRNDFECRLDALRDVVMGSDIAPELKDAANALVIDLMVEISKATATRDALWGLVEMQDDAIRDHMTTEALQWARARRALKA